MTPNHELRLLVCDDDDETCELMELIGRRKGYKVQSCRALEQLHEALAGHHPNAVLLDVRWGDANGLHTAGMLRTHGVAKIIALSGHPDVCALAEQAELDGFVQKPFRLKHMEQLMDQLAEQLCCPHD